MIASEPWLDMALPQLERNGALFGVHGLVRSKKHLTPPTLLEMVMLRQFAANEAECNQSSQRVGR
jgi:hypothetical protein